MPRLWLMALCLTFALGGCAAEQTADDPADDEASDDDPSPGDDDNNDDNNDNDDVSPRSFYLAAAPFKFRIEPWKISNEFDVTGFLGRLDLLSVHMDFFGIPWDEFATGAALPAAWVAQMDRIKQMADDLGVEVFLSLTPLSGWRDGLGQVARETDGELEVVDNPHSGCYDFAAAPDAAATRAAYLAFVRWMVERFAPTYLAVVIEQNLYDRNCPAQYDSLIALSNAAYEQEKALNPALPIFQTFVMDIFWGYNIDDGCAIGDRTCLQANLDKIAGQQRDRFGISSYPLFMTYNWTSIPDDYYRAVTELTGDRLVFGETGYPNRDIVIPYPELADPCLTLFHSSDAEQIDHLTSLFEQANAQNVDLITWWSLRDYLPDEVLSACPCGGDWMWCALYEVEYEAGMLPAWLSWGAMGVLDFNAQPKAALAVWNQWLERPLAVEK